MGESWHNFGRLFTNFVQLCSTLLNFVQLFSIFLYFFSISFNIFITLLKFVHLCLTSTFLNFVRLCSIFLNCSLHFLNILQLKNCQLCSTMFNNVQLFVNFCLTLLNFVQLWSTLFNFSKCCSTLFNCVQDYSTLFNFAQLCTNFVLVCYWKIPQTSWGWAVPSSTPAEAVVGTVAGLSRTSYFF